MGGTKCWPSVESAASWRDRSRNIQSSSIDPSPIGPMTAVGHFRRFEAVGDESGLPLTPDVLRRCTGATVRAKIRRSLRAAHHWKGLPKYVRAQIARRYTLISD